ncbi:TonB-dependent receptor [Shewanella sp. 6_MG-2023]|uniref:TonB-dependent receptor n=1 Tax=Shewanella sp. 6_MG-2023 TaxID=3062660 RepID=UPI0026E2A25E|nr:TonB-dependent receptor [Shewanella sp. 6_MG-2023]MDO6618229.1 TonB-dependent receptor [Shewanella sp. 6_MG-2023]
MSHTNRRFFAKSILATAVGLSLVSSAHAEDNEPQTVEATSGIERIEISARGRVETLQNVPDSVTAFSADMIQNQRIENFRDVADLTPNLSQLDNFRPGLARITIRGLITPQVGDAPLAFVVDGVTAPDLEFINQDLVDIERIEVMRGAQGALYGKGAIGGAVIVTTKKPTEELEGTIKGSYGNGNTYNLNGVVSGALNDDSSAFFRVGGYTKNSDGLIDNVFLDEPADYFSEDSVFAQLEFDLTDDTSLNLRGRYTTSDSGFAYYQGVTEDSAEDFDIGTSQNIRNNDQRDVYEVSAKLTQHYDLGTFDFITAYSSSENKHFYDGDYSADPTFIDEDDFFRAPFGTEGLFDVKSLTVESRFTSQSDQDLRWAVSAFYQDKKRDNSINFFDDFLGDVPLDRDDFTDEMMYLTIADKNSSKAWALSGQINYDITDKLELTAALRFDSDKRESYDPNFPVDTFAEDTFSQWQPKVTLAYQMNEELLLYTGYSKGFRSGGFNEPAEGINRVYNQEVSDSYEAGFKTTLFSNKLTLNGALFVISQSDAQITQFNVDSFTLENLAIDDVLTKGAEIELGWAATENLNVRFNAGYIDSEIKEFTDRPELEGESQVWVPEYTYSLSADHYFPISSNWSLVSRADIQVQGPQYFDIEIPHVTSSTFTSINAGVGLKSDDWTVQLYVNNLTDERTIEDIFFYGDGVTDLARMPNKPRTYGIEAIYNF